MTEVVITAAKRTPVGAFLGAYAATPAHELGPDRDRGRAGRMRASRPKTSPKSSSARC
jgi:acetyl-CoA acetyltransferase